MKDTLLKSRRIHSTRGVTLVEMILVMALIAIILGALAGKFSGVLDGAQIDAAAMKINETLNVPLTRYKIHMGNFPTTEQGLAALAASPAGAEKRWRGPYIDLKDDTLLDPWKQPLQYRFPGTNNLGSYDLFSYGPDGVESADDVTNW